jgi:hypothetical protein
MRGARRPCVRLMLPEMELQRQLDDAKPQLRRAMSQAELGTRERTMPSGAELQSPAGA